MASKKFGATGAGSRNAYLIMAYLLLLVFIQVCNCQIPSLGRSCPKKVPAHLIDVRQLSGKWYEIEATPLLVEWMYTCTTIKLTSFFERHAEIKIEASEQNSDKLETVAVLNASLSHTTNGQDGKLKLKILSGNITVHQPKADAYFSEVYVLDTDYKNWAIVWTCISYRKADARAELVWILSRQRSLDNMYYQLVRNAIVNFNLEGVKTLPTVQDECAGGAGAERDTNDL